MPTCSLQQQVFALSNLANAGAVDSGAESQIQPELEAYIKAFLINPKIQPYIGSWTLVWGPVVYERPSATAAANVMFVAQGTDAAGNDVYVAAVAATNPSSIYDLVMEDFDVTQTPWPYSLPSGADTPHISQGTIDGVDALLAAQDPLTSQTLRSFLEGVQSTTSTLVFTGHSLGGALAPALALALFGAPAGGTMDLTSWGAVYLYPTAGPTVGDANYVQLWTNVFPPATDAGGEQWNQLVWNTLDVVPHAWAMLGDLDKLYPVSDIPWTPALAVIKAALVAKADAAGTFKQPANVSLQGTFAPWEGASPISSMVTYFMVELLYQHVWAYFDLLNVSDLRQFYPGVTNPTKPATPPESVQALAAIDGADR